MVTHYSTNGNDSACGRSSQTLVSTQVADQVSCKSCQRSLAKPDTAAAGVRKSPSLAELRKSAKAAVTVETVAAPVVKPAANPTVKPVSQPAARPARSGGFSVKSAWAARLAEQSDRCRLPRGKAKQQHV